MAEVHGVAVFRCWQPGGARTTSSSGRRGVIRIRNTPRTGFERAVVTAELGPLTPHALRHTAASLAIAAVANVKVVQTTPGHISATMTLDLYALLFADQLDEVADDSARAAADRLRTEPAVVYSMSRELGIGCH